MSTLRDFDVKQKWWVVHTAVTSSCSIELAYLKEKEESHFGHFGCFSAPLGVLLVMKTLEDGWYFFHAKLTI